MSVTFFTYSVPERQGAAPGESLLAGLRNLVVALPPDLTLGAEANVDLLSTGRTLGILGFLRSLPQAQAWGEEGMA